MSLIDDIQTQKSFQYLREVETLAQDILTKKEEKLDLANAQNKYREALRALETVDDRNTWMKSGPIYIQRPTKEVKEILRNEISIAEDDLKALHNDIREKSHKLRDLEHEPRLEGFGLKPLSAKEANAFRKGFGL